MGGIFLTVMYNNAPFCRSVWMEEQKKKNIYPSIYLLVIIQGLVVVEAG